MRVRGILGTRVGQLDHTFISQTTGTVSFTHRINRATALTTSASWGQTPPHPKSEHVSKSRDQVCSGEGAGWRVGTWDADWAVECWGSLPASHRTTAGLRGARIPLGTTGFPDTKIAPYRRIPDPGTQAWDFPNAHGKAAPRVTETRVREPAIPKSHQE